LEPLVRTPLILSFLFLIIASAACAAPPKVDYLFPAGGQRGQTVVVTASGDFSTWPVKIWSDRADVTLSVEQEKGKFKVTIAPDAPPGVVWLRAYNEEGASALRPFIVGMLPEIEEAEPNDGPAQAQSVADKIVINGRLAKSGDADGFAISLQAGQTLVASLQANHVLGSPMDGVLQICELVERRGKPEAFVLAQNHDAVGLDPQLAYTARQAGKYLVRVFAYPAEADAGISFAGSDKYVYRLTLTTRGFVDHVLPLAVRRGQPAEVRLFGWNLPAQGTPLTVASVSDPLAMQVTAFHPDYAGASPLAVVDHTSVVEQAGQVLEVPSTVSGQLTQPKEVDSFGFHAKKGVKLRLKCEARSLGDPLRGVLKVSDEAGKAIAATEPNLPSGDTELAFTPPADGRYTLAVSDEHARGGLRFVYRLTLEESLPDFGLTLAADSFVVSTDKPLEIPVTLGMREGIAEAIELKVLDLPAGVSCEPVKSADKPQNGQIVKLVVKATPEAAAFSGPIRVVGTAGAITRTARTAPSQSAAVWLTVK
jgi:hypothetical protein